MSAVSTFAIKPFQGEQRKNPGKQRKETVTLSEQCVKVFEM